MNFKRIVTYFDIDSKIFNNIYSSNSFNIFGYFCKPEGHGMENNVRRKVHVLKIIFKHFSTHSNEYYDKFEK